MATILRHVPSKAIATITDTGTTTVMTMAIHMNTDMTTIMDTRIVIAATTLSPIDTATTMRTIPNTLFPTMGATLRARTPMPIHMHMTVENILMNTRMVIQRHRRKLVAESISSPTW